MTPGPAPRVRTVLVAVGLSAVALSGLGGGYRLSVAVGAGILAVAAVGVDLCVGSAGLLVFSAPAFMLVGALSSALVAHHAGLSSTPATLAGLAVGLAVGAVLAVAVGAAVRRVQGIGVALVTLFFLQLVRAVARQQEAFGGTIGLGGVPPFQLGPFRAVTPPAQAVVVMVALAVVAVGAGLFVRSFRGLELRAVAGDATAAAAAGIPAGRRRMEAFVAGSLCATLAGSLYAHVLGYVSADAFGVRMLTDLLLIVFLGGAGSVWGVFPGAVAVMVVPELWLGTSRFDLLVRGAALLAVLTLAPTGIAGAARRFARRRGPRPEMTPTGGLELPAHPDPGGPAFAGTGIPGGPVLTAAGLVHRFGAVTALDDVSLTLTAGEVCAVIGSNGAGKTTLFNVLSGQLRPHAGRVVVGGVEITGAGLGAGSRAGVARTFQEQRLFPGLTVAEHVLVAAGSTAEVARRMLDFTGLRALATEVADELPFGQQRRVELARALASSPAVLLLDEPASGLSAGERAELADLLARVAGGPAILLVEHDVTFALSVATRLVVLEAGRLLFDGPVTAVADAGVLDRYLARPQPGGGSAP